ncbi:A-kinase anchor protein 5 isoform X34 [Serinus canaria]|uniref:A-kinase anchor protein 5 isoform X33 n=1 Tax=Serinus canaria TaxID=9135 RepID=UPI0021CC742E|nr:A-kinase anchor protein 5 isoform X33 [Serinus canaria]XP_050831050.1 A-kinase anchor protein 5 isoform X34 [Serinus canaria]
MVKAAKEIEMENPREAETPSTGATCSPPEEQAKKPSMLCFKKRKKSCKKGLTVKDACEGASEEKSQCVSTDQEEAKASNASRSSKGTWAAIKNLARPQRRQKSSSRKKVPSDSQVQLEVDAEESCAQDLPKKRASSGVKMPCVRFSRGKKKSSPSEAVEESEGSVQANEVMGVVNKASEEPEDLAPTDKSESLSPVSAQQEQDKVKQEQHRMKEDQDTMKKDQATVKEDNHIAKESDTSAGKSEPLTEPTRDAEENSECTVQLEITSSETFDETAQDKLQEGSLLPTTNDVEGREVAPEAPASKDQPDNAPEITECQEIPGICKEMPERGELEKSINLSKECKAEETVTDFSELASGGDAASVQEAASVQDAVSVKDAVSVQEAANVQGATSVQEAESVQGATSVQEAESVQDAESVKDAANVQDAASMKDTVSVQDAMSVQDAASMKDAVSVQDAASMKDAVSVQEAARVQDATNVQDAETAQETANVQGAGSVKDVTSMKDAVSVPDATSVQDAVSVQETVSAQDVASMKDTASVKDAVSVKDPASLQDVTSVQDTVSVQETVSAQDVASVEDAAGVQEAASVEDAAGVQEAVSVEDAAGVQEAASVEDAAGVQEAVSVEDVAGVQEAVSVEDAAGVQEAVSVEDVAGVQEAVSVEDAAGVQESVSVEDAAGVQEAASVQEYSSHQILEANTGAGVSIVITITEAEDSDNTDSDQAYEPSPVLHQKKQKGNKKSNRNADVGQKEGPEAGGGPQAEEKGLGDQGHRTGEQYELLLIETASSLVKAAIQSSIEQLVSEMALEQNKHNSFL